MSTALQQLPAAQKKKVGATKAQCTAELSLLLQHVWDSALASLMARTYGEIIQTSFGEVFAQTADRSAAVFVDIGSGKGLIAAAAVGQGGYARAVGIEKYRDKYEDSLKLRSSLPEDVQFRLEFIMSDVADLDLRQLIKQWAQAEVMLFCNNLAFGQGVNGR